MRTIVEKRLARERPWKTWKRDLEMCMPMNPVDLDEEKLVEVGHAAIVLRERSEHATMMWKRYCCTKPELKEHVSHLFMRSAPQRKPGRNR